MSNSNDTMIPGCDFDANNGDKFAVYENGKLIRGVIQVNSKTGEYLKIYVHDICPKMGERKRVRPAIKICYGKDLIVKKIAKDDPRNRREFLIKLIKENGWTTGAEIGLAKGATTFELLNKCPKLTLTAVDPWPGKYAGLGKKFRKRMQKNRSVLDRLRLIELPSADASHKVENASLDFVFIDGDHSEGACENDIQEWKEKVKPGGLLCGHDANWDSVYQACVNCFGEDGFETWDIDNIWLVWIGGKDE